MSSISTGLALSAVTTAGGLYPALDQAIIQLTMPFMYARNFCVTRSLAGMPGNTYVFPRQSGSRTAVMAEISPGSLIGMDSTPYSYSAVTVYKIAQGFLVTRELIEDTFLPVVQDHMVRFAVRAANKIDLDVWKAIINNAGNTFVGTGTSMGATGTSFSAYRSGAIGQYDVMHGIELIKSYNYFPDYIGLNPVQEQDLYILPMFSLLWQYGTAVVQQGSLTSTPNLPLYGPKPVVSNNVPAGTAVILASGNAPNPLNQYAPQLFFVEKRPLQTMTESVPGRDAEAVYFTARYSPSVQGGGYVVATVTGLSTG